MKSRKHIHPATGHSALRAKAPEWKAYFPDEGGTADDAIIILGVLDADEAAEEAVEYDWSSQDGWERGESEFAVIVINHRGEEFQYRGYHEQTVQHRAEPVLDGTLERRG